MWKQVLAHIVAIVSLLVSIAMALVFFDAPDWAFDLTEAFFLPVYFSVLAILHYADKEYIESEVKFPHALLASLSKYGGIALFLTLAWGIFYLGRRTEDDTTDEYDPTIEFLYGIAFLLCLSAAFALYRRNSGYNFVISFLVFLIFMIIIHIGDIIYFASFVKL